MIAAPVYTQNFASAPSDWVVGGDTPESDATVKRYFLGSGGPGGGPATYLSFEQRQVASGPAGNGLTYTSPWITMPTIGEFTFWANYANPNSVTGTPQLLLSATDGVIAGTTFSTAATPPGWKRYSYQITAAGDYQISLNASTAAQAIDA